MSGAAPARRPGCSSSAGAMCSVSSRIPPWRRSRGAMGSPSRRQPSRPGNPRGRMYDLIVSGQAWHWVNPELGVVKAASLLHPGGHLGVFWNRGRPDSAAAAALEAVYRRLAPEIAKTNVDHQAERGAARPASRNSLTAASSATSRRVRFPGRPPTTGRVGPSSSQPTATTSGSRRRSAVRSSTRSATPSTRSAAP